MDRNNQTLRNAGLEMCDSANLSAHISSSNHVPENEMRLDLNQNTGSESNGDVAPHLARRKGDSISAGKDAAVGKPHVQPKTEVDLSIKASSIARDSGDQPATTTQVEQLLTIKAAGKALGLHYHQMLKGKKLGLFPVYRLGNGRALVRLSEVVAAIERSRSGGDQ